MKSVNQTSGVTPSEDAVAPPLPPSPSAETIRYVELLRARQALLNPAPQPPAAGTHVTTKKVRFADLPSSSTVSSVVANVNVSDPEEMARVAYLSSQIGSMPPLPPPPVDPNGTGPAARFVRLSRALENMPPPPACPNVFDPKQHRYDKVFNFSMDTQVAPKRLFDDPNTDLSTLKSMNARSAFRHQMEIDSGVCPTDVDGEKTYYSTTLSQKLVVPAALRVHEAVTLPFQQLQEIYQKHFALLQQNPLLKEFMFAIAQATSHSQIVISLHGGCRGGDFQDGDRKIISIKQLARFFYFLLTANGKTSCFSLAEPCQIFLDSCSAGFHYVNLHESTAAKFQQELFIINPSLPLCNRVAAKTRQLHYVEAENEAARLDTQLAMTEYGKSISQLIAQDHLRARCQTLLEHNAFGGDIVYFSDPRNPSQQYIFTSPSREENVGSFQSSVVPYDHLLELLKRFINQEVVCVYAVRHRHSQSLLEQNELIDFLKNTSSAPSKEALVVVLSNLARTNWGLEIATSLNSFVQKVLQLPKAEQHNSLKVVQESASGQRSCIKLESNA